MESLSPQTLTQIAVVIRQELQRQASDMSIAKVKTTLSVSEAADLLDASENFNYGLLKNGKLERVKIEGKTYVTIKSLKEIQKPL